MERPSKRSKKTIAKEPSNKSQQKSSVDVIDVEQKKVVRSYNRKNTLEKLNDKAVKRSKLNKKDVERDLIVFFNGDRETSLEEKIKKVGRPKGSKNLVDRKNKTTENIELLVEVDVTNVEVLEDTEDADLKKKTIDKLNDEILSDNDYSEDDDAVEMVKSRDMLEQILFKVPIVKKPIIGSPKEVQTKLDNMAKKLQADPNCTEIFDAIHLYMHGYLINMVLKKFPFIMGYQTVDIYQETLIALRFKAIPNFKKNKGMSFLNFAKMCIRRHLITLLHASKHRNKDKTMNLAISLDSSPLNSEDDNSNATLANIISDTSEIHNDTVERTEAYNVTKQTLVDGLSDFERIVLEEYLSSSSYKEISKDISDPLNKKYNTKSIDNALLRIRKKAIQLLEAGRLEEIPMFIM